MWRVVGDRGRGGVVVTYLRLRGHRRCFLTLCRQEDQRLVSWGTLNAGSLKFERGQGSFGGEKFAIRQMTTDFFFFFSWLFDTTK